MTRMFPAHAVQKGRSMLSDREGDAWRDQASGRHNPALKPAQSPTP